MRDEHWTVSSIPGEEEEQKKDNKLRASRVPIWKSSMHNPVKPDFRAWKIRKGAEKMKF